MFSVPPSKARSRVVPRRWLSQIREGLQEGPGRLHQFAFRACERFDGAAHCRFRYDH